MGSIVPIASQALTAFQVANQVISTIKPVASVFGKSLDFFDNDDDQGRLALQQMTKQQQLQQAQSRQNAALEKQEILGKAQEAEKKRREALKRAVSRQRARYGSSGVSSAGGSSEAVLLGLFDESNDEKQERERLDSLRFTAIDQRLAQSKRVNTLAREQLKEKNKLKNTLSPLETATSFLRIF